MKFLTTSLLLFTLHSLKADLRAPELLYQAFQPSCPVTSLFEQGNTNWFNSFVGVIQQVRQNESCQSGILTAAGIRDFENSYQLYQDYRGLKKDKLAKEKQIAEYSIWLAQGELPGSSFTFSTDQEALLEQSIFDSQIELISQDNSIERFETMSRGFESNSLGFQRSFQGLLNSINSSEQCLPSSGSQFVNLVGAGLSTAGSITSGASSLISSLAGTMVSSLNYFFRDRKFIKSIEKANSTQWPRCIRCISEAITDDLCNSVQTRNFLEVYRSNSEEINNPKFEGIDLLNKKLSGLDNWLGQVLAGAPVRDFADLIRRNKVILQYFMMTQMRSYLEAWIGERDALLPTLNSKEEVSQAIYESVVGMSWIIRSPTDSPSTSESSFGGGSPSQGWPDSPVYVGKTRTYFLFEVLGFLDNGKIPSCEVNGSITECPSLKEYMSEDGGILLTVEENWNQVKIKYLEIIDEVQERVARERSRVSNVDPLGLFREATRIRLGLGKTNALKGLKETKEYLSKVESYLSEVACKNESCSNGVPAPDNDLYGMIQEARDTREMVESVIKIVVIANDPNREIQDGDLPRECKKDQDENELISNLFEFAREKDQDPDQVEKALELSNCLTSYLRLYRRGNDFLFEKIRNAVSDEFTIRVIEGELSEETRNFILATRADLVSRISSSLGGNRSITEGQMIRSLSGSIDQSYKILNLIFQNIHKWFAKEILNKENSKDVRYELCFNSLAYLKKHEDKTRKFLREVYPVCSEAVLVDYPGQGPTLRWTDYISKRRGLEAYKFLKSKEERACSLNFFNLQNRIISELGEKEQLIP